VNRPDTLPATVFDRLCQHPVVNGQALAQELGVSRAAIWKAVRFLRLTGLPIDAVSGRGYRLACPLSPLEAKTLNTQRPAGMDLHVLFSTASTNDDARRLSKDGFVLAEHQFQGRGRLGRQWLSVPGCSVLLSGRWRFANGIADLAGLNLAVAAAVVHTAEYFGWQPGLKWPNDLVCGDNRRGLRKIGGILIEISGEMEGPCQAVVGLGLNWQLPPDIRQRIAQPTANLLDLPRSKKTACNARRVEREAFVARLLNTLDGFVRGWCQADTPQRQKHRQQVLDIWQHHDRLRDTPVVLRASAEQGDTPGLRGIYRGVDASGALILDREGVREVFHSGELSLRPDRG